MGKQNCNEKCFLFLFSVDKNDGELHGVEEKYIDGINNKEKD